MGGSNNVSTDAISNKEASGTHFHLDTLIAAILKWAVAPTTKTGGFFVFDVDAEPRIDDGHGGGRSRRVASQSWTVTRDVIPSTHYCCLQLDV